MSTTSPTDPTRAEVPGGEELGEPSAVPRPEGWVPVDRRWHGLDRSSFRYALPVLLLAVVLVFVVPSVDAAVPGGTPVVAGERVGLNGGVAFTPAVGWTLTDGLPLGTETRSGGYPPTAAVTRDAVTFALNTTRWTGTPAALLDQFQDTTDASEDRRALHVVGDRQPFTTAAGQAGVLARYRSTTTDGLVATLVLGGTGVLVRVVGPSEVTPDPTNDVGAMLMSVAAVPEEQR